MHCKRARRVWYGGYACENVESVDINGKRSGAEMGKPVDQWGEGRLGNQDRYTKQIMI